MKQLRRKRANLNFVDTGKVMVPFFCHAMCTVCSHTQIDYFPEGTENVFANTECGKCGRRACLLSGPLITAN